MLRPKNKLKITKKVFKIKKIEKSRKHSFSKILLNTDKRDMGRKFARSFPDPPVKRIITRVRFKAVGKTPFQKEDLQVS